MKGMQAIDACRVDRYLDYFMVAGSGVAVLTGLIFVAMPRSQRLPHHRHRLVDPAEGG